MNVFEVVEASVFKVSSGALWSVSFLKNVGSVLGKTGVVVGVLLEIVYSGSRGTWFGISDLLLGLCYLLLVGSLIESSIAKSILLFWPALVVWGLISWLL